MLEVEDVFVVLLATTAALFMFNGCPFCIKRALEQADRKQICRRETDVMKNQLL